MPKCDIVFHDVYFAVVFCVHKLALSTNVYVEWRSQRPKRIVRGPRCPDSPVRLLSIREHLGKCYGKIKNQNVEFRISEPLRRRRFRNCYV